MANPILNMLSEEYNLRFNSNLSYVIVIATAKVFQ